MPDRGPDGPLGVVLVRHGSTEHGHHVVPDELVHAPPEALHLLGEAVQAALDQHLHGLVVEALGDRGVARQVGEQDRHRAPLLAGDGRLVRAGPRARRRVPCRRTCRSGRPPGPASRTRGSWRSGRCRRPCRTRPPPGWRPRSSGRRQPFGPWSLKMIARTAAGRGPRGSKWTVQPQRPPLRRRGAPRRPVPSDQWGLWATSQGCPSGSMNTPLYPPQKVSAPSRPITAPA